MVMMSRHTYTLSLSPLQHTEVAKKGSGWEGDGGWRGRLCAQRHTPAASSRVLPSG